MLRENISSFMRAMCRPGGTPNRNGNDMFPINHRTIHLLLAAVHLAVAMGWIDHPELMVVPGYSLLGLSAASAKSRQ